MALIVWSLRHLSVIKGSEGYLAMNGQIVDATIVSVPRQQMTREEKEQVEAGKIPQDWQDNPTKLAQKDRDARWITVETYNCQIQ